MPYERPFCACARAVKALARRYECSDALEHWLMRYAVCTPILCMCESREGSGKTAWILSLVWVLAERICRMYALFAHVREQWRLWRDCTHAQASLSIDWWNMPYVCPFCVCVRAVKALARRYECSGASEQWLVKYAVCTPILRMCESGEGSGKTAWILSLVWVLTERICRMYALFAHVREQWRLWRDCTHAQASLSIDWWNMPFVCPFCACVREVMALVRLHAC